MLLVYAVTIFLGAGLLFLVQPMIARQVLPLLGGSPAVWNTCMVFFQAALLAGYGYAHLIGTRGPARRWTAAHLLVLAACLIMLPIGVPAAWAPGPDTPPTLWLLGALAVAVGVPFTLISTGAPLLQRWFAATGHRRAADPYFLYAASNAGSLLALVAYPLVVERALTVRAQLTAWSVGYALWVILVAACAVVSARSAAGSSSAASAPRPGGAAEARPTPTSPRPDRGSRARSKRRAARGAPSDRRPSADRRAEAPRPDTPPPDHATPWVQRARWVALALVPSSLMLGLTQYISTDLASAPLLWVIPLALYLVTFIAAFARKPVPGLAASSRMLGLLVVAWAIAMLLEARRPAPVLVLLHALTFFAAAMVCHGRLALERPAPARLTEFYLLISLGGVLGGAFNALAAPVIFPDVYEYPIALVLACCFAARRAPPPTATARVDRALSASVDVLLAVGLVGYMAGASWLLRRGETLWPVLSTEGVQKGVSLGVPALALYLMSPRPRRLALGLAALCVLAAVTRFQAVTVLHRDRTFFGVIRVVESRDPMQAEGRQGVVRQLLHGTTNHGVQATNRPGEPLTYYHRDSPIGQVFAALGGSTLLDRVAAVGLGTGSIAAYHRPGRLITFYEIDPAVVRIARNPDWFTFLADAGDGVDVRIGDGRLLLARAEETYGLIILDAFSSDAIPAHLLTREAFEVYLARLDAGGAVAVHISNRHLDLAPVITAIGRDLDLFVLDQYDQLWGDARTPDPGATPDQTEARRREQSARLESEGKTQSHWMLVARTPEALAPLRATARWSLPPPDPTTRAWTDDRIDILSTVRWDGLK